ncbi:MAG: prepilin-type N-terminal cleavage/methylation domain-containing protein [Deltaproteobacteria bacterium]|nr:prepilin-type N-terminal cleavage/methylation domain-containing protein [Deltaproteobacteria bacterium]
MRSEEGFTLIELLVVIAIIGILAAIAIPQFAAYRKRAFAADVKSNLRNAAVAEEAYFVDYNVYKSGDLAGGGNPIGFNKSATVTVTADTSANLFTLTGTDTRCTGDSWIYRSSNGAIDGTSVSTCM